MKRLARLVTFFSLLAIIFIFGNMKPASGDSYTVYFESDRNGDTEIYRIDGEDATQVTTGNCVHPSVTADGSMLLYTKITETSEWGTFWNVYIFEGGEERRLTRNEIYDEFEPAISRDGTFAAFSSLREGNLEIITLPIDQLEMQLDISNSPKPDENSALGGSNRWIYWTGRTGNYSYIFRAPGSGGESERITIEPMIWEEHPSVSADYRYVVYTYIAEEVEEAVTEEGVTEEAVTAEEGTTAETDEAKSQSAEHKYPGMGGVSPGPVLDTEEEDTESDTDEEEIDDGRPVGNSDIWILDSQTGERFALTNDPAWDGNPCISADGEKIVFTSDRDGNYEIYMINRDGTGLTRLTNNDAVDDFAAIS
jgi:Tol biopolymer transport system component